MIAGIISLIGCIETSFPWISVSVSSNTSVNPILSGKFITAAAKGKAETSK